MLAELGEHARLEHTNCSATDKLLVKVTPRVIVIVVILVISAAVAADDESCAIVHTDDTDKTRLSRLVGVGGVN